MDKTRTSSQNAAFNGKEMSSSVAPPLAERCTTWTFIRSLLWKNWMLKKRHPVASFLEIALPCLVILVLGLLKSLVTDVQVPDGWSDGINTNGNSSQGTSYNLYKMSGTTLSDFPAMLPKFTMHETSMWGILLFMGNLSVSLGKNMNELPVSDLEICTKGVAIQGLVDLAPSSRYALPSSCNGKVAPYKIAVAPDNTFTRDYFMRTMELWYPRIELQPNTSHSAVIPSLLESVQFFKTEQALEEYVKGNDYASSQAKPRIYGGIVFDKYPNEDQIGSFQDIEYTVRLNSTLVPKTGGSPPQVSPFQKSIETEYYTQYATTGFMTLQTLVTRFVTCMPKWNATTKTTTGECQNPQTTAKASIETDTVLLATLENDPILSSVLKPMAGLNPPFSPLSQLLSNDTTAKLLKPLRQAPQPSLGASVAPFPIKSYVRSGFYDQVATVLALILLLSYLYSISRLLVVLIQEKEKRLREYMKILGVHEHAIVLSWYLTYSLMVLCGSVLQTLMGSFGLFASSSIAMIFVFFFFFGLTVLSFGFLISTIFSQARVGTFVGMVLFFLMYFVSSAIKSTTSESLKTAASIFSPVGLSLGLNIISKLEATGTGVHFANASDLTDNYRFTRVLFMFVLDTVLYTLLGLYCENVVPKDHGTTLKWYFPLSPAYWKRCSKRFESLSKGLLDNVSMEVEDHPHVEPVSAELRAQEERGDVLTVQGLRKVFAVPGGEKIAVQGLSVTMYKHQITCLLGHNGAGKTTLISMLTGMVAPTSGDAFFRGLSIRNNMNEIRRSLGICFQHDVLFDELTVEEHLRFFGRIKGYNSAELEAVITQQLQEVGLTEKRHVKSTQLSGGMKRKLSVAVSLLGDSSLVFLDEPTSGMDPYSRRSTWEMLLKARQDRVMVLTTHFMDEADILGDRIAIMVEGELRCCGSSLFLKNRFGAGYTLTLVKDEAVSNAHNVIDFVTSHVPSAQVLSHVGSELAFQLPLASSSSFAAMFAALDEQLKDFGVLSYGISVTTLEEVFIKVVEASDSTLNHGTHEEVAASRPSSSNPETPVVAPLPSRSLFWMQLTALLMKRFRYAKRDKKMLVYSLVLPMALLLIGFMLLQSTNVTSDDPKLALTSAAFPRREQTPTPFYCLPGPTREDSCRNVMTGRYFTDLSMESLSLPEPSFDSASPTVFGVHYTDPSVNTTGATGYGLRLGQAVYERGYGLDTAMKEGQYGAYLVQGDRQKQLLGYNLFVNTTAAHGAIILKALMDQTLYRVFAAPASVTTPSKVSLKVNHHPLPLTAESKALYGSFMAFTACIFICIAFTYYPASMITFLVKEKQPTANAKHQQLVSGVSLRAFWLAHFLWDFGLYLLPCVAALVMIGAFQIDAFTATSETFVAVIVLFLVFGLAICPFTYCLSHLFHEPAAAQTTTIMLNFILGVVLLIVAFLMDSIASTNDVNAVLVFVWRLSPLFNLGYGLLKIVLNKPTTLQETQASPFRLDLMGWEISFLVVTAIAYGLVAVGIDYIKTFPKVKDWQKQRKDKGDDQDEEEEEDDVDIDVKNEAMRVARGDADEDAVKLVKLRKVYRTGKVAVANLSFGLQRGECFGFLGINGAGKTTTMKMLTGADVPSRGTATLSGFDIVTQQRQVRRELGYCPQFDALFELLTVRDHLELFAAIKGVPRARLNAVVDEKIAQLKLQVFADKLAGSLSGGNKRKVSLAIAMIGEPRILFLDEPSTGMDPVSRRMMWDVLAAVSTRDKKSTIVLTTHSMEEAEALCSRVGIMVGGRLRCLGSIQHLKSRFGDGLALEVKLEIPTQAQVDAFLEGQYETWSRAEIEAKCRRLGSPELVERLVASHPTGYGLAVVLEREGGLPATMFASWCLEEVGFEALCLCLKDVFNVTILERQNAFCRFKLHGKSNEPLRLSKVFEVVEARKEEMGIREYHVSQTSLEQLFNSFAAQQTEEKRIARGFQE